MAKTDDAMTGCGREFPWIMAVKETRINSPANGENRVNFAARLAPDFRGGTAAGEPDGAGSVGGGVSMDCI